MEAGYNARDAAEYLSGMQAYLNHPNVVTVLRFPGSDKLRLVWYSIIVGITLAPVDDVLAQALQIANAIFLETYVSAHHT